MIGTARVEIVLKYSRQRKKNSDIVGIRLTIIRRNGGGGGPFSGKFWNNIMCQNVNSSYLLVKEFLEGFSLYSSGILSI